MQKESRNEAFEAWFQQLANEAFAVNRIIVAGALASTLILAFMVGSLPEIQRRYVRHKELRRDIASWQDLDLQLPLLLPSIATTRSGTLAQIQAVTLQFHQDVLEKVTASPEVKAGPKAIVTGCWDHFLVPVTDGLTYLEHYKYVFVEEQNIGGRPLSQLCLELSADETSNRLRLLHGHVRNIQAFEQLIADSMSALRASRSDYASLRSRLLKEPPGVITWAHESSASSRVEHVSYVAWLDALREIRGSSEPEEVEIRQGLLAVAKAINGSQLSAQLDSSRDVSFLLNLVESESLEELATDAADKYLSCQLARQEYLTLEQDGIFRSLLFDKTYMLPGSIPLPAFALALAGLLVPTGVGVAIASALGRARRAAKWAVIEAQREPEAETRHRWRARLDATVGSCQMISRFAALEWLLAIVIPLSIVSLAYFYWQIFGTTASDGQPGISNTLIREICKDGSDKPDADLLAFCVALLRLCWVLVLGSGVHTVILTRTMRAHLSQLKREFPVEANSSTPAVNSAT